MELAQGDILGGKYRVERLIGRGGMGYVFAATHLELDELVAIKVLHGDAQSALGMARFQREARAAVRLRSQHVARVLDVDRLPDGGRYMVLEYLEGQDLHKLVRKRGRIAVPDAASYILQACEGLAEAHALGMVHRDIKLQNLFLTQRADGGPLVKILDFGMVKVSRGKGGEQEASLTDPSTIIGSLRYMAPEQLRADAAVDARADVWSLGVCLYCLISGELPFDEEHLGALYAAIGGRPAIRLDERDPAIPAAVADIVERALEKNVTRRYQDVRELAEALEPFGRDAETVVGVAWRISHLLRPRAPIATSSSTIPDSDADLHTAPTPAMRGAPLANETAVIPRTAVTTLAFDRTAPASAAPPASTSTSASASAPPPSSSEVAPAHTRTDPGSPAEKPISWRSGFALMAIVAVIVGFIGTSGLLRARPVTPASAAEPEVKPSATIASAEPSGATAPPATVTASAPAPTVSEHPRAPAPPPAANARAAPRAPLTAGARLQGGTSTAIAPPAAAPASATTKPKNRDRSSPYDQY